MEMHLEKPSNDFHRRIFEKKKKKNKHTHTQNSLLSKDKLFLEKEGIPSPSSLPPDKMVSALFCKVV